jgi:hypothetical protein
LYSAPARRPTGDIGLSGIELSGIELSGIELSGIELRSGSVALSSREGKGGLVGFGGGKRAEEVRPITAVSGWVLPSMGFR